jgi:hypothetical protein
VTRPHPPASGIVPARKLAARIAGLFVAAGRGFETEASDRVVLDLDGLVLPDGRRDRHHGATRRADARVPWYPRGAAIRNTRHVSIVSPDDLRAIAAALAIPQVLPQWLGANLVLEGVPSLSMLPRGTRILAPGGAALAVDDQNAPCRQPGRILAERHPDREGLAFAFVREAKRLRGLVAFVERPGELATGDTLTLLLPEQWIYGP